MYIDSRLINNVYNMFLSIIYIIYTMYTLILFTLYLLNTIISYYYNKFIFVYILLSLLLFMYSNMIIIICGLNDLINIIHSSKKKTIITFVLYLTYTIILIKHCQNTVINPNDYQNNNEYLLHKNRVISICVTIYMTFVLEVLFMGLIFYALKKGPIEQQPVPVPQIEPIPVISIIIDKQECAVCYEEKEKFGDICKCNQKTCEECLKKCNRICPTCRQPF